MFSFKLSRKNSLNFTKNFFRSQCFSDFSMNLNHFIQNSAFLNGKWIQATSVYPVKCPFNKKVIGHAPECDENILLKAVKESKIAFETWSLLPAKERSQLIHKLYELHLKYQEDLARIITLEIGKPITESRAEILYGASFLQWFSEQAKRINGEILQSPWPDKVLSYVKEPAGPVAIITPWNFPNAMITRKLAAALAAGCTTIIRPAHNTPFSALAIAKLAEEAGFPPGVINVIPSSQYNAAKFGKIVCEHEDISTISFTGSTKVGKILLEQGVNTVKRMCLELGGNAPFIVFSSADLHKAVEGVIASKFRNNGQTCVCTNRIYVQSDVYDRFILKLSPKVSHLKVGNPTLDETKIGPLIDENALIKVTEHIEDAINKGAKIHVGGKPIIGLDSDLFFEPTLISHVNHNMKVCIEETFGPLAAIIKFDCEEEVLHLANNTRFGLASYFYSRDLSQIKRVARSLKTGIVGINEGIVSCAEAPFGGVKESGFGREGSHLGVDEFLDIKYICQGSFH